MKSNLVLICIIVFCLKDTHSSFSHNVQDPYVKNYEENIRLYSGDATLAFYIPTPADISTVVEMEIEQGKEYCKLQRMPAKAEKLSSFRIDYDMNLNNIEWNVQIMSVAQDSAKNINYVLLQNGTLLIVSIQQQRNPVLLNRYSYQSIGATNTWLMQNHELSYSNSRFYVLVNQEVKAVSIHIEGYWSIASKPIITGVISWFASPNKLYVLTNERIHSINGEKVEQFGPKGSKFIDFSINGPNYFILDGKQGILTGTFGRNTTKLIQIQYPSKSLRIVAGQKVLMVIYEKQGRNYLAEYFLNHDGSVVLNRYYHSYYEIKDVQLKGEYAVINTYNGIVVMKHSINRKSFSSLSSVEFLYQFQGARTVKAKWLASSSQLHILLVLKDQMQYLSLEPLDSTNHKQLNTLYARCSSQNPLTTDIKITYKGICSSSSLSSSSYLCIVKTKDTISFTFAHERKQAQTQANRYIFLFACILIFLFSILILLGLRKRVSKALNRLKRAESAISNRKQQHSQNMEQTFNADIVH